LISIALLREFLESLNLGLNVNADLFPGLAGGIWLTFGGIWKASDHQNGEVNRPAVASGGACGTNFERSWELGRTAGTPTAEAVWGKLKP